MTAQIAERIYYKKKRYAMCTEPLNQYFDLSGGKPQFESHSTALWRGYIGTWEIIEGRLYLIELEANLMDGSTAQLNHLFPDFPDRVFAHWYTGKIQIPDGKLLEYVHSGYESIYERDICISLENGVVMEERIVHNGTAENPEGPDGYQIGGMTIFPKKGDT